LCDLHTASRFGFNLIDQDNSGQITREELTTAIASVFSMMNSMQLACPDPNDVIST
jgi:Ca2+-binding EF-hand superfamily protein